MSYWTYILLDVSETRTYVGQTSDLEGRLRKHNRDEVRSTKGHGPWRIVHQEEFATRGEAMKCEKWFKSRKGREKLRAILG